MLAQFPKLFVYTINENSETVTSLNPAHRCCCICAENCSCKLSTRIKHDFENVENKIEVDSQFNASAVKLRDIHFLMELRLSLIHI